MLEGTSHIEEKTVVEDKFVASGKASGMGGEIFEDYQVTPERYEQLLLTPVFYLLRDIIMLQ